MLGSSEEPPGTMEADPHESMVNLKDTCEQSKSQLESVKDIMLRNKQTLKKKEEELQKYAKRLSKFKTRTKKSRSNKSDEISSPESTSTTITDTSTVVEPLDDVDDISQAKTPKAKSSLLQKKLAEDRKIFQQRSKELTESKRAVEEKVEALKQQFEEKYVTPVSIVSPVSVTSQFSHPITELSHVQDKDNKIAELSNKIFNLEAIIIDLQDNLKEKDSVIDSKTKAITLMSADLSKKGKTTLDNLEDTKDEMRSMQQNFVLVETSLRSKNDNLLKQLEEKAEQVTTLEESVQSLTEKLNAQKQVETVNADFSRSTMDTLVDTKDAMKSMQENFVLIESSLKSKTEHLLKQLEEREIKLAEAEEKILNLEVGMGIEKQPDLEELLYKVEKLEEKNRNLEDEKYELQKLIAGLQDKIISNESSSNSNLLVEKDNRIVELEGLITELKTSNQLMEEQRMDLEKQIMDLNKKNEDVSIKVIDLEKQVFGLENEKSELTKSNINVIKASKENDKEQKLIKELDELNKSMIKMKVEHKNKVKSLQKQINNFKKISDTNAELVKLGNQVALLEEEKGNLQLSLVDFDELKASASDWQQRINDLEGKATIQAKEIQAHIEAIGILENQKLDVIQELHAVRLEVSSLEAENAESENLRVTAEMKVVDLEEELESSQRRALAEPLGDSERGEFQRQIDALAQDNERLTQKISKLEELKSSSEVGSTDSFVKTGSNVDSTESFEALATDADKTELLRRIDGLTRENGALLEKLTRYEEKGSSDSGSTESFERIPEAGEEATKLESLARKNVELAAKVTRLEEKLAIATAGQNESVSEVENQQPQSTLEEHSNQVRKPEESSSLAMSPVVLAAALAANWETDELEKPIEEELSSVQQKTCTEEVSAIVEQQGANLVAMERNYESCQELADEQKTVIDNLRSTLAHREVELVEQLRSEVESKEIELRSVIAERNKLRDELEILSNREKAAEENVLITHKNLVDLNDKLDLYAEDQQHLVDRLAERQKLIEQLEPKLELEGKLLRERLEEEVRKVTDLLEDKKQQQQAHDSVQKQLSLVEANYEENRKYATQISHELRQAYKAFEYVKEKHVEDMNMLNQRLEDVIEELQVRIKENANLENELLEKNNALEKSVPEEIKLSLETKLAEVEQKAQQQLDKLKKYAAVAKKKTAQCDELEAKLAELEEKWTLEKSEKEARNMELRESLSSIQLKDNRIADMEEELQRLQVARDEALRQVETIKAELFEAMEKDKKIADMKEELEHLQASRNEALHEIEIAKEELNSARQKDNKIADMEDKLQHLQISRDEALQELELAKVELTNSTEKDVKIAELIEELQRLQKIKDEALFEVNNIKMKLSEAEQKDNKIANLEEELQQLKIDRDQALEELKLAKVALNEAKEKISSFAGVREELQHILAERDEALQKIEANLDEFEKKDRQIIEIQSMLHRYQNGQESCDEIKKLKMELQEAMEKDKVISNLNQEVKRLELVREEALHEVELLNSQLNEFRETDKIIVQLKEELKLVHSARDDALHEVELIKAELNEARDTLNTLSEAKDKARELGVRMEVMEAEYVEQLSQINSLRAENGLLLSRQAQVNERLENVEKESEERRVQLEKLEKEQLIAETRKSEEAEGTCGRCTSRLQALEAMLQERDAEIENLDNELHNSIGNLVQMQEQLRLSTVPSGAAHDVSAQESYDELARRYNTLMSHSEEMRIKYETTLRHNEDLLSSVSQLQNINAKFQVRLDSDERNLIEKSKEQNQESSILAQRLEQSRSSEEDSILTDGWGLDTSTFLIDAEAQQQEQTNETEDRQKREVPPPLFDASVFGASLPQVDIKVELALQVDELKRQVMLLNEQLANERITAEILKEELEKLKTSQLEAAWGATNVAKVDQSNNLSYVEQMEIEQQGLKVKLELLLSELETLKESNEELLATQVVYRNRLIEAEERLGRDDSQRVAELEGRIARIVSERDLLQLQINDVTREYNEQRNSNEISIRNLRDQLEASTLNKNQLIKELEDFRRMSATTSVPIEQEIAPESMWEVDEDPWGLSDKVTPQSNEQHEDIPVIPSATIQLQVRIDELEEQLKILDEEKAKLLEENKTAQLKTAKYVKKLKEYKLQLDSLQQQLKSQRSISSFGADLDSTIEEELKAQITSLGKDLAESREESRKLILEKENLLKRIDLLTAASERFADIKEKQDSELHIWQMRYKELEAKLQHREVDSETKETSPSSNENDNSSQVLRLEEEIKELKENLEALALDNEKLQQLLEEHSSKRQNSFDELQTKTIELTASNDKLMAEYNNLRKQYEQSLMDANDQVQNMRQNCELLKQQLEEKKDEIERITSEILSIQTENDFLYRDADKYKQLRFHLQQEVDRLTDELSNRPEAGHKEAEVQALKGNLKKLELSIEGYAADIRNQGAEIHNLHEVITNREVALAEKDQRLTVLHSELQLLRESTESNELAKINQETLREQLNELKSVISDRDELIMQLQAEAKMKDAALEQSTHATEEAASKREVEMPMFTFPSDNEEQELQRLRTELEAKNEEIKQLQDTINKSSVTHIVQDMQDNINELYNNNSVLEEQLVASYQEIESLKLQVEESQRRRKRSLEDEEDVLAKLQAELRSRNLELEELQQQLEDKESHLKAALERNADDAKGLRAELLEKHHQLESLTFTVAELQSEVASLRALEGLAADDRAAIDKLSSEKEQARRDAQETVERIIKEKMEEMNALKLELAKEKESLTEALSLRERDLENLKVQMQQASQDKDVLLEQRTNQLVKLDAELSERERRLAELSITKDTEIHNMGVQLSEKNARLEELIALSEEEERQLLELRKLLEEKEVQISGLQDQLAEKGKEIELMQHALQRHVVNPEQPSQVTQQQQLQRSPSEEVRVEPSVSSSATDELDLALYMLHQRDMRCEELTRELMQLLEERDTLQLRLSNAIRVNEELRKFKTGTAVSSPKRNSPTTEETTENAEPLVQDPSPSHSEGPIEIAREAINSSIGEDKKALAQKLLQLKSVDQGRDVRLRDERELRHAQQMSLLEHGDVLSTLPPEAAARLVNANYTLSRDVQSQSSVLMNWLWGKSTPKIVHM